MIAALNYMVNYVKSEVRCFSSFDNCFIAFFLIPTESFIFFVFVQDSYLLTPPHCATMLGGGAITVDFAFPNKLNYSSFCLQHNRLSECNHHTLHTFSFFAFGRLCLTLTTNNNTISNCPYWVVRLVASLRFNYYLIRLFIAVHYSIIAIHWYLFSNSYCIVCCDSFTSDVRIWHIVMCQNQFKLYHVWLHLLKVELNWFHIFQIISCWKNKRFYCFALR